MTVSPSTQQSMTLPAQVDVLIIGGGMVGASLAAMLPEHMSILLVERFALPAQQQDNAKVYQPSFDARSSALSHSSFNIFTDMGLWPRLAENIQTINKVHVSDRGRWGSTLMEALPQSADALGYVIENAWLGRCLMDVIQEKPNVTFASPAAVTSLCPQAGSVKVGIQCGDNAANGQGTEIQVETHLAVVADGAQSQTCQRLGIAHALTDYGHSAIVANVSSAKAHQGIAYERFTDQGPLALLPLKSEAQTTRSALIWTMPTALADSMMAQSDEDFLAALQQRFGHRQGAFTKVGKRVSYPLKLSRSQEQVRQNIVVLGNAAHSLHPVAGQGFNLALRDVKVLCDVLVNSDTPLGDLSTLMAYQQAQQQDQQLTTVFSDVLPNLFSRRHPLLAAGRGLGLLALELMPYVKSTFIDFATGLRR